MQNTIYKKLFLFFVVSTLWIPCIYGMRCFKRKQKFRSNQKIKHKWHPRKKRKEKKVEIKRAKEKLEKKQVEQKRKRIKQQRQKAKAKKALYKKIEAIIKQTQRLFQAAGVGITTEIIRGICSSLAGCQETIIDQTNSRNIITQEINGEWRISLCITIKENGSIHIGPCKRERDQDYHSGSEVYDSPYSENTESENLYHRAILNIDCETLRELLDQEEISYHNRNLFIERNALLQGESVTIYQTCEAPALEPAVLGGLSQTHIGLLTTTITVICVAIIIAIPIIIFCIRNKMKKTNNEEDDLIPVEENEEEDTSETETVISEASDMTTATVLDDDLESIGDISESDLTSSQELQIMFDSSTSKDNFDIPDQEIDKIFDSPEVITDSDI